MNDPVNALDSTDNALQPQPGDVAILFRNHEDSNASGIDVQYAVLAALRQAGILPTKDPERDARDIAEFHRRNGRIQRPIVRRFGRLEGWH